MQCSLANPLHSLKNMRKAWSTKVRIEIIRFPPASNRMNKVEIQIFHACPFCTACIQSEQNSGFYFQGCDIYQAN